MSSVSQSPAWTALQKHHEHIRETQMRALFADDPQRFEHFSLRFEDILFDYSKNRITDETMTLLLALARQADLGAKIESDVHRAEDQHDRRSRRAAHRPAKPLQPPDPGGWQGRDARSEPRPGEDADVQRCGPSGEWTGYTGKPITDVVNIGIGGSDLGPDMVTRSPEALSRKPGLHVAFRLQHRRHPHGRDTQDSQPGNDAVSRRLQNVHHAGNHDQRPFRAGLVPANARRMRRRRQTFRRRCPPTSQEGEQVRHRSGQYVRVLGLGRRALFAVVSHRPFDCAYHRHGSIRGTAHRRA